MWVYITFFYIFFLAVFYTKFIVLTKRKIYHIFKYFWFFLLIIVQFWSMKLYLYLFYNTIYLSKFSNNAYFADEVFSYRITNPEEWIWKRRLQYEYFRMHINTLRFYTQNIWEWKDVYFFNFCFLVQSNKALPLFINELYFYNFWLIDYFFVLVILICLYYLIMNFYIWFFVKKKINYKFYNNYNFKEIKYGLFNKK